MFSSLPISMSLESSHFMWSLVMLYYIVNSNVHQDESVRLWNVQTGICILIFAGAGGHRNEVLSVVWSRKIKFCISIIPSSYNWKIMDISVRVHAISLIVLSFWLYRTSILQIYIELQVVAWIILSKFGQWKVKILSSNIAGVIPAESIKSSNVWLILAIIWPLWHETPLLYYPSPACNLLNKNSHMAKVEVLRQWCNKL